MVIIHNFIDEVRDLFTMAAHLITSSVLHYNVYVYLEFLQIIYINITLKWLWIEESERKTREQNQIKKFLSQQKEEEKEKNCHQTMRWTKNANFVSTNFWFCHSFIYSLFCFGSWMETFFFTPI